MASGIASKIKMPSADKLLCVPDIAGTVDIGIERIHSFEHHPFKVIDDEKMETLVESIRQNGILSPVIVRPDAGGNYEMVSGHRRLHASKIIGLNTIPAIVKEMTDDESIIYMVDSNIQREELLPSEKAFAFKMKMDALNRRGERSDLTLGLKVPKWSHEEIGQEAGIGGRQVKRYIRLTYLIPELLQLVDEKKIGLNMAVDISFFDQKVQGWLYEYVKENSFLKPAQIALLKEQTNLENMTQYIVISILNSALPEKKASGKVTLSEKNLNKYFPPHYSAKQREELIFKLLEKWKTEQ